MARSNPNIEDIFTDAANAIREKKGTSTEIYPVDFADEILSITGGGGGDQPQLHPVTELSRSVNIATWSGDDYTEAYKLYLDSALVDTITSTSFDITSLTISFGSHTFGVAAAATNFVDSDLRTLSFMKSSITVNVTDGIYSGPSEMFSWETAEIVITPNVGKEKIIVNSVMNADYSFNTRTKTMTLSNPTGNVTIDVSCEVPSENYIIGFSGAAQSNPALTRTDEAVDAIVIDNDGVLEIDGINMSKVWGGYIGNDEEELTWDATSSKFLHDGVEYTGNVFSKINRFFTKARYVEVSGRQVLDGYQLCFGDVMPDDTWQDWFFGKPYTKIGCYKARGGDDWTNGLQSKQGFNHHAKVSANDIAAASNISTSTTAIMHMKWYNQHSILQVLFMALFGTRQSTDVFPTYRAYNNWLSTGYLDEMRSLSTCATGYSTAKTGNMFLGIEDFIGYGFDCIGGVKSDWLYIYTTLDYNTFDYANTYTQIEFDLRNFGGATKYISELQESTVSPGLLLPFKGEGTSTTYYCNGMVRGDVVFFLTWTGPFGLNVVNKPTVADDFYGARLCGEPW